MHRDGELAEEGWNHGHCKAEITLITLSRIIIFARYGLRPARDRACRKWMNGKMVAQAAAQCGPARSGAGDRFNSGLMRVLN
ncbi:hypothetical protein MESS2_780023 [Mesorhizobium metallidurans STM 2683]|uniref:Uncharacterized protein n=1 Tax=Mesorhizobium metallidurans STM 2683 TaxID=1297569 RepID=M5F9T4_9HYPH|nr:hypothetical protein MESS2_780023 [Mesorhizobium metallidurans STM 2683]